MYPSIGKKNNKKWGKSVIYNGGVCFVPGQISIYLRQENEQLQHNLIIWLSSNFLAGGPVFLMQNIVDKLP